MTTLFKPILDSIPMGFDFLSFLGKPKTAQGCYNRALDFYESKHYQKAIKFLGFGESLDPSMSLLFYTKGLCYEQLADIESAKKAFQQALILDPDDTDSMYNLGRLYYSEDELDIALAYAEQAQALVAEPGDAYIEYLLGLIYEQQSQVPAAITAYEKSLELDPEQTLPAIFLSKLYMQTQEFAKATFMLQKLIEKNADDLEINYELALCLAKTGDWEESIRFCKRVVEIDPLYTKGYNQLGLSMYCTDKLEEAVNYYEKAIEIDSNYATAINNLAYTYEKMQKYDKAIENFKRYLPFVMEQMEERLELEEHIELLERKVLE